jgi:phosphoglycolate phosphatase-like HAD superfamily hydrolase
MFPAANHRTFVLFDVDGTLVDSIALENACFQGAVAELLGVEAIDTDWSSYRHTTDPGVFIEIYQRHVGRLPTMPEVNSFQDLLIYKLVAAIARNRSCCGPIPGAASFISALKEAPDFTIGVVTGAWRRSATVKLEAARINIDGLPFASGDDAIDRFSIFSKALARSSSSFDRLVLVGDGVWDVRTAQMLGAAFLGVGSGERAQNLRSAGAVNIIENFLELSFAIEKLETTCVPN